MFTNGHDFEASAPGETVPTVFVIDDDEQMRASMTYLIESFDLPVEAYESAQAFLEQFDPDRPGCVVCDVRMPGMSGLELQDRLRAAGSTLPMIFMTAFGDVPSAVRAMRNGALDYLGKPVGGRALLDRVRQAVLADRAGRSGRAERAEIGRRLARLTRRELEVLAVVLEGLSSKEIASRLVVSFKTVESHRSKIMKKMEAPNVPQLMRMIQLHGLPSGLARTGGRDGSDPDGPER